MAIEYFGQHLDKAAYELAAIEIDPTHRSDEASLAQKCWFDYHAMPPAQRTYLFAHHYNIQTKTFCETAVDARTSEDARGFTPDDVFMSRDITSMWLARRASDALTIPYDFTMRFAQKRALERLFTRFPRPNQLYGEEFEVDLQAAWNENIAISLRYSRSARFHIHPQTPMTFLQKRHLQFLLIQVSSRPKPHVNILARMLSEKVISEEIVRKGFDKETSEKALAAAKMLA